MSDWKMVVSLSLSLGSVGHIYKLTFAQCSHDLLPHDYVRTSKDIWIKGHNFRGMITLYIAFAYQSSLEKIVCRKRNEAQNEQCREPSPQR